MAMTSVHEPPFGDDDLAAHAAGHLEPDRAAALEAAAATDPALARRLDAARRLEAALRAQGREEERAPVPLGLVADVLRGIAAIGRPEGGVLGAPAPRVDSRTRARRSRRERSIVAAASAAAIALVAANPFDLREVAAAPLRPLAAAWSAHVPAGVQAGVSITQPASAAWDRVERVAADAPGGGAALAVLSGAAIAAGVLVAARRGRATT